MGEENPVEIAVAEGVATMALNRPQVLNALNGEALDALRAGLAALRGRPDVRALLLTGRGRAFCAGADLGDPMMGMEAPREERGRRFAAEADGRLNALMRDLYAFDRPKVAAVNGLAAGGGVGLALVADIVVAARSAYFMQVFTPQLGLVPDMGVSWHLPRLVGRARALALTLLGERLPAEQAAEWGLIWRCVDDDRLMEEATALAARLAAGPPLAQAALTRLLDESAANSFGDQLDRERDVQSRLVGSEDFAGAVEAFRDKRKPTFKGR